MGKVKRFLVSVAALIAALAIAAAYVTPWPSVLVIRYIFDRGAEQAATALAPRVPADVVVDGDLAYDPADVDARFDIYRGANALPDGPVIVWFHGGGFVSGRRQDVGNYLKILAGRGFTVVNVDYTTAPEATYPTPVRQANAALAYLAANRERLRIDPDRLVLAGDSAGAQIAAQTAALITNPSYAKLLGIRPGVSAGQLSGVLLHCGVYDVTHMGERGGVLGWFVHSTGWAYSGARSWRKTGALDSMALAPHLTPAYPPAFVSAGNADPLGPQSVALAQALAQLGIAVTEHFFPAGYTPPLGHEYQFDLGTDAGEGALGRSVEWLKSLPLRRPSLP